MRTDTILVVVEEAPIRWSLGERLKFEGYQVLEAETGADAIQRLADGVDLVLLDSHLPDADGPNVLREIQKADPDVVVILHDATKPLNLDDVSTTVARSLESARVRREMRQLRDLPAPTGNGSPVEEFELPAGGVNLEQVERNFVVQALRRTGGNQTKAATLLGMNRDQIRYRIEKFNLADTVAVSKNSK
jgi:two-component system, NtrC family, response regulator AtoC